MPHDGSAAKVLLVDGRAESREAAVTQCGPELLKLVPADFARRHLFLPLRREEGEWRP